VESLRFSKEDKNFLEPVYAFAKARKVKLYLVGGVLRDLVLGRKKESPDFDFCLKKGAINFGRKLAKEMRAGFVVLDREHGACRVVKKAKNALCTLDFTDFRGKTLEEDLRHRDFTFNAVALELESVFRNQDQGPLLIDPLNGLRDLKLNTIKAANSRSFLEDPLRILRAFSFSALFGFKIDKETLRSAARARTKLARVSQERIRDEMFKIFDSGCAYEHLVMMDKLKILKGVFPEIEKMRGVSQGPYHHLDIWKHSLETVRQMELLIRETRGSADIRGNIDEVISSDRKRRALMKLAALLHDIGKPKTKRRVGRKVKFHGHERVGSDISEIIARRLKLSCDEMRSLQKMVLWHLRPGYLGDQEEVTQRAIFRYFRDAAEETVATLLLSIADQRSTRGRLTTRKDRIQHEKTALFLIKEYFRRKKEKKMPRLVNGDDLIRRFKLEPSPLIGKILSEIEELQAIGRIKNKTQALEAARQVLHAKTP
jgi:poly(A) polymerase